MKNIYIFGEDECNIFLASDLKEVGFCPDYYAIYEDFSDFLR